MLSTAIILPDEAEMSSFSSILTIGGIELVGIFYSGKNAYQHLDRALLFSSPEIIPMMCDLLIVADPYFCTFDYLSFAIRNGCHLFLSDKLQLTKEERRQLIHLAAEGGTYIQIQNDFLFHPFQEKIRSQMSRICFIEVSQSAPAKQDRLNELLFNNLLMILRAAGSLVHKIDVFCGTVPSTKPDIINIHLSFKNGSVATLTLKFIDQHNTHLLSIYASGEVSTFDFVQNKISHLPEKKLQRKVTTSMGGPLREQITDFIRNIAEKNNPGFSLDDEILVFLLMEKIRKKIEINSFSMQ
jgi:hypothetical protein